MFRLIWWTPRPWSVPIGMMTISALGARARSSYKKYGGRSRQSAVAQKSMEFAIKARVAKHASWVEK